MLPITPVACYITILACYNNTYRLGELKNRINFLPVLEVGKYKNKVPANLISGESALPGLYMATFLLCLHMAKSKPELFDVSLYKDTNPTG